MADEKKRKGESNLVTVEGLGARIKEVREARSMSQRALANHARVPPSTIGRLEVGDMNGCYTNTLASIAEVLDCSCEYLVSGKGPQDRERIQQMQPTGPNYEALVVKMSPQISILLEAGVAVWTSEFGWGPKGNSIIGKHINDLVNNTRLWIALQGHLAVGQQMDTPIRMKINGLWKDVYCKMIDGSEDEHIEGNAMYTLLTLMDIPLRQRAMEMYQAEKAYMQPALANSDF